MKNHRVILDLTERDPWFGLAAAIVRRAVEDASGNCPYSEYIEPVLLQREAQTFLSSNNLLALIAETAGMDAQHATRTLLRAVQDGTKSTRNISILDHGTASEISRDGRSC